MVSLCHVTERFQAIERFLHFADNSTALSRDDPMYDKMWKTRLVIDSVNIQAQASYSPGKSISIDESMMAPSFLQYMPKKPTKWGIKVWVCSESKTGYIYNFHVYTGKGAESQHGLAHAVVMDLIDTTISLFEEGRVLYVNNFYTSPVLFEDLYNRGTFASGTVRTYRKHFPSVDLDEQIKQKGDMYFKYHGPLTAGNWRDKRDVYFLSTMLRDEKEDISRRGAEGALETVQKPKIITDYNNNMSGVVSDQNMIYYACGRHTLKWYKRVFWRLLEHCITNNYILFKQVQKPDLRKWRRKKYRMELAYSLTAGIIANRIGQGQTPSDPPCLVSRENILRTSIMSNAKDVLFVHIKDK